jgi:hypothetical protein
VARAGSRGTTGAAGPSRRRIRRPGWPSSSCRGTGCGSARDRRRGGSHCTLACESHVNHLSAVEEDGSSGGELPAARPPLDRQCAINLGTKLWWQSTSLATRRCGFDSHRLHLRQRLRSVNGKHAPFVRPRCGFNSCRRLQSADVAQQAEHRVANPDGPVRFGSSASQVRGVTGSTASSNLAGPGSIPGGPVGTRFAGSDGSRRLGAASQAAAGPALDDTTAGLLVGLGRSTTWDCRIALVSTSAGS